MARKWNFDSGSVDLAPAGFSFGRTGAGRTGRWMIKAEKDAPSGHHVLAQLDTDSTSYRFPVAVAEEVSLRDFRLAVHCKPISGRSTRLVALYSAIVMKIITMWFGPMHSKTISVFIMCEMVSATSLPTGMVQ